jgi:hypothetical protein
MNQVAACAPPATLIRLRRDGQPPLRFTGRLIAYHSGQAGMTACWHDLALYAAQPSSFAASITAQRGTSRAGADPRAGAQEAEPVRCHAALWDGLEPAIRMFETHDAGRDAEAVLIAPLCRFRHLRGPAAWQHMAGIEAARGALVHRYHAAVGTFLASLGALSL